MREVDFLIVNPLELKEKDFSLSEVVISARTKDEIRDLKSALHKANVPWYDITSNENIGNKNGVRLSTLHSMKGLEFKVVFLADVNNRTCPFLPSSFRTWDEERQKEHLQSERSLMYVAISRAVQKVVLFEKIEQLKRILEKIKHPFKFMCVIIPILNRNQCIFYNHKGIDNSYQINL